MKKLIAVCLLLSACNGNEASATFYTPCEPSKYAAMAAATKMAALFCTTGDKTNRYTSERGRESRCVKPDGSTGWYVKFEVTCLGELP